MIEMYEQEQPIIIYKENNEIQILAENITDSINQNLSFNSTNEKFFGNSSNSLLKQKRNNFSNIKFREKHTKYSCDNLKRECKHLLKILFKLNQIQKTNSDVEFNKIFINKTLKEILSQNITKQFTLYEQDHNKKVIDRIILEKKDIFEKIFNLTFIQCVDHFIENKKIEELNGLTLFSELKKQIINKYENDGESYYENLRLFLKSFENKINRAKSRKKRVKESISGK